MLDKIGLAMARLTLFACNEYYYRLCQRLVSVAINSTPNRSDVYYTYFIHTAFELRWYV